MFHQEISVLQDATRQVVLHIVIFPQKNALLYARMIHTYFLILMPRIVSIIVQLVAIKMILLTQAINNV